MSHGILVKKIGLALVLAGVAGFFVLRVPAWRWESLGVGVTGAVLIVMPSRRP
jgi:hypothetical protein